MNIRYVTRLGLGHVDVAVRLPEMTKITASILLIANHSFCCNKESTGGTNNCFNENIQCSDAKFLGQISTRLVTVSGMEPSTLYLVYIHGFRGE